MLSDSPTCLVKLPAKTLNRICSWLFNPKDLLNLAMTAKTLQDVVVPNHIEFRIIRCDIRRRNVWNKIAVVPALTSKIVALEIIPEDPTSDRFTDIVLPINYLGQAEIDKDDPSEWPRSFRWGANQTSGIGFEISCAAALAKAIEHMATLRCFHWADYTAVCSPDIFLALKHSCPSLTDVEVMIDGDFLASAHQDFASCPLWQLKDLTRFSLTFMHVTLDAAVAREYVERMTEMLIDRCPDLEELLLRLGSQDAPNDITCLVTTAKWPCLKRLSLAAKVSDDHEEALAEFLAKHPRLHELQLCQGITNSPIVRLSNLPHLHSLHLGWGVACKDITDEVAENLEYLGLFLDSGADERLGPLLDKMPKLRQFELVGVSEPLSLDSLTSMVKACPSLERLAIHGAHLEVEDEAFADIKKMDGFFSGFDRLTHLSIRGKEFPVPDIYKNFAQTIPTLEYLEIGVRDYVWYTIDRKEDGSYTGYHTTEHIDGLDVEDWGGLYQGARVSVY